MGIDCDEDSVDINAGAIEVCDGIDNDCNDAVDDDIDPSFAPEYLTCNQLGECIDSAPICSDARWQCSQRMSVEVDAEISCDGLDNDCDGRIDEDD